MPRASLTVATLMIAVAFLWSTPFLWTLVASFRPESAGGLGMASLLPDFVPTLKNFALAFESGDFAVYYLNTAIVAFGILAVQIVTISLAGYAFARLSFPGRDVIFYVFLLQLMLVPPILIVPNLRTIVDLGLYGTLAGVMAPYFASAFGTFLMRQTFRSIPRDFEEAAVIDGAHWGQILWHVLLPMALRIIIPPLTSEFMNIFKNSSVALTVGLLELTAQARRMNEYTFQGFETFTAATLLYVTVAMLINRGMAYLEYRKRIPGYSAEDGVGR